MGLQPEIETSSQDADSAPDHDAIALKRDLMRTRARDPKLGRDLANRHVRARAHNVTDRKTDITNLRL